jgi:hypothetical protein
MGLEAGERYKNFKDMTFYSHWKNKTPAAKRLAAGA